LTLYDTDTLKKYMGLKSRKGYKEGSVLNYSSGFHWKIVYLLFMASPMKMYTLDTLEVLISDLVQKVDSHRVEHTRTRRLLSSGGVSAHFGSSLVYVPWLMF
jgi:hypothetical protein